ncbi:hypothetical protein BGW80DRAFT_1265173, partial [Lactifluus volemus]
MDSTDRYPSSLRIAAVVSFYMFAAWCNKTVLNASPNVPLLFLFLQLIIAVILLHNRDPRWDYHTMKKLFPVVSINVVGLVFNMFCLREVEVTFFQIARGLVLPLTISVTSLTSHSHPTTRVIVAAAIVTTGFFIGVTSEGSLPVSSITPTISLLYGVVSSLGIAVHSVLVKSSLPYCNNSAIQLAYWTNAGSAVLLSPFVLLLGEPAKLLELASGSESSMNVFVWGTLVTGFFGFLLCLSGLLSIKVTSPVTHMFSSAVRSVIQTLLGVWLFHDVLTMYYTWVKATEQAQQRARPADLEALLQDKDDKEVEER